MCHFYNFYVVIFGNIISSGNIGSVGAPTEIHGDKPSAALLFIHSCLQCEKKVMLAIDDNYF